MRSVEAIAREREKYYRLFQLAQDQVRALEADNRFEFDRIIAVKDEIIKSFGDTAGLLEADPALATIVEQIQDRDRTAMLLLHDKFGRLKRRMAEMNQNKAARAVYARAGKPKSELGAIFADGCPRFIDRHS
jgi:hypothetical protein